MIRVLKGLMILVCVIGGIILLSNLEKGFETTAPDQVQLGVRPTKSLQAVVDRVEGAKVLDEEQELVEVPYGEVRKYLEKFQRDRDVMAVRPVHLTEPGFSMKKYLYEIKKQVLGYLDGQLGTITYTSRENTDYPIQDQLMKMVKRSLSYLVPAMVFSILAGYLLALWAVLKPRAGKVFDILHNLLLGIPDFFLVALLQFFGIFLAMLYGHNVIKIMAFASDTPFVIPFLAISVLPGALMYGALRIAVAREWEEGYIKTAYAKGLSRPMVVVAHILRNTTEDLLAVLPRTISVAITSLVVAEVICGIFGIGGYAINTSVIRVTSLPTTCAILACFVLLSHLIVALLRKRLVVNTKEGA